MKSYAIYDDDLDRTSPIGYLFYYEKVKSFIIELSEDLAVWDAPVLFQGLVRKGIFTISKEFSMMWVRERVIPSGRQNIGLILKNHKMKEYSEIAFLTMNDGRCIQDNCYIKEIGMEKIPDAINMRMRNNISDCFMTEDNQLLCMFKDNTVRKVDLKKLINKNKAISYVLENEELKQYIEIGVGGYSVVFNKMIDIMASDLRENGVSIPLTVKDFYNFVQRNIVDTPRAYEMLNCTRQNLAYMVNEGKLKPIVSGIKGNLYDKGNIEELRNN